MSHDHHNNNGHHETKPVAFTTPLILGVITVFIILCFVSLGNPCHGHEGCECKENCSKECMEACEKGDHSKHPAATGHEEGHAAATHGEHATTETAVAADSTKAEPTKEEHKEEAHH